MAENPFQSPGLPSEPTGEANRLEAARRKRILGLTLLVFSVPMAIVSALFTTCSFVLEWTFGRGFPYGVLAIGILLGGLAVGMFLGGRTLRRPRLPAEKGKLP